LPRFAANVRGKDGDYLVKSKRVAGFANTEEEAVGLTAVVPFLLPLEDFDKIRPGCGRTSQLSWRAAFFA
jgi:hypothetical protein